VPAPPNLFQVRTASGDSRYYFIFHLNIEGHCKERGRRAGTAGAGTAEEEPESPLGEVRSIYCTYHGWIVQRLILL
jgi:hypothetical protein